MRSNKPSFAFVFFSRKRKKLNVSKNVHGKNELKNVGKLCSKDQINGFALKKARKELYQIIKHIVMRKAKRLYPSVQTWFNKLP